MEKKDLRSATKEELIQYLQEMGQPAFRGKQLFSQLQQKKAKDLSLLSQLPKELRSRLAEEFTVCDPQVVTSHLSAAGDTAKLLLEFADKERVEMAVMLYRRNVARSRATCCVSSQSGCAMGCVFCATGMFQKFRNLTAGEIVRQVQLADDIAIKHGFCGITNIVYMGMGEPLANIDQVHRSILLLNHAEGMNIGARKITVSTCGLVPQIYQMAKWGLQVGLAVSLHSADEEKRRQLMPGASHYSLDQLMEAIRYYRQETGRRVTCEYALIHGVNDQPEDARKLAALLTGTDILVNIIPVNPLPERGIAASSEAMAAEFCRQVGELGVDLQIRESRGRDIQAACGQLRKGSQ